MAKLTEGAQYPSVQLNITELKAAYPQIDFNELASQFKEAGGTVAGSREDVVLMLIDGLELDTIKEIMNKFFDDSFSFDDYVYACINCDEPVEECNSSVTECGGEKPVKECGGEEEVKECGGEKDEVTECGGEEPVKECNEDEQLEALQEGLFNELSALPLNEKKVKCCPPKKGDRLISLTEALKAANPAEEDKLQNSVKSIEDIINYVKGQTIGEYEANIALDKLKKEQKKISAIKKEDGSAFSILDVPGTKTTLKQIANAAPTKAADVTKLIDIKKAVKDALNEGRPYLYTNTRIQGTPIKDYDNDQLVKFLMKAQALDESANVDEKKAAFNKKFIEVLENELSYRRKFARFVNEAVTAETEEERPSKKKNYLHENVYVKEIPLKDFSINELHALRKKAETKRAALNEDKAIKNADKFIALLEEEIDYRLDNVRDQESMAAIREALDNIINTQDVSKYPTVEEFEDWPDGILNVYNTKQLTTTITNVLKFPEYATVNLNWINVADVDDMSYLFKDSNFNGDISRWDVSNVKTMAEMFMNSAFNGDISSWDVSNVTDMEGMFQGSKFNGDISQWNVSGVENMSNIFFESDFAGDLTQWVDKEFIIPEQVDAWELTAFVAPAATMNEKVEEKAVNEAIDYTMADIIAQLKSGELDGEKASEMLSALTGVEVEKAEDVTEPIEEKPAEEEAPAETEEKPVEEEPKKEETPAKEAQPEDTDVQEVELARVIIEMPTEEDAKELYNSCLNVGIPADAMDIVTEEEDEEPTVEETPAEEEHKEEEEKVEESLVEPYPNLKALTEAEGEDEEPKEEPAKEEAPAEKPAAEEGDSTVKFILTDTDYIVKLQGVLADVYGISKEEFEQSIGGEIVEETNDEEGENEDGELVDDMDIADIFG